MKKYYIILCFIVFYNGLFAQFINPDTIKISGLVLDAGSLIALPNVHIRTQKNKGAITDSYGQFTFRVNATDSLSFSYIGYKNYQFVIPDTLKINNYIMGVMLHRDTITLSEVIILPWMNKRHFKDSFAKNLPDQNTVNATRNINLAGYTARSNTGNLNNDYVIDMQLQSYAMDVEYRGMIAPNQQVNFIGLASLILFYTHQQLTKEEKARIMCEQLQKYIQETYPH